MIFNLGDKLLNYSELSNLSPDLYFKDYIYRQLGKFKNSEFGLGRLLCKKVINC